MKQNNPKWWVFLTICLFPLAAHAGTQAYDASNIRELRLIHNDGVINIVGKQTAFITVNITSQRGEDHCQTKVSRLGSVLEIKTSRSWFDFRSCRTDLVLTIPENLPVSGDIGASQLQLDDLSGRLGIKVGAGDVMGNILSSDVEFTVGAGSLRLTWDRSMTEGRVVMKVGAGTADLFFPRAMTILPSVTQGLGHFMNDANSSQDSRFRVEAELGIGNVSLHSL